MGWQDEIITLYLQICDIYKKELWSYCQRFTNYADLSFSDEEVMVIYLFGTLEGMSTKKQIYNHAKNYWHAFFPKLPSYVAFIQRINKLSDALIVLNVILQRELPSKAFSPNNNRLVDSMPIIIAQRGRRFNAKVAPEIADKNGYCPTKKLHYYGIKLHIVGSAQPATVPIPEAIGVTSAGTHDIKAYEQILPTALDYNKFADKAYISEDTMDTKTYTPVKKCKGQKVLDAAEQLYSTAIAKIRQPIESLFNWLEEKTKIQMASKVRSYNGLMVHIFGKLAAAFTLIAAKFSS